MTEIKKDPPPNCRQCILKMNWYLNFNQFWINFSAKLKDDDLYEWVATIQGPPNSVYEGGIFVLDIHLSPEYPYKPPKVKIVPKLLHSSIYFSIETFFYVVR